MQLVFVILVFNWSHHKCLFTKLVGCWEYMKHSNYALFSRICISYSEQWSLMYYQCSGNTSFWRGCFRHVSWGRSKVLHLYFWSIWHILYLKCVMCKSFHAIAIAWTFCVLWRMVFRKHLLQYWTLHITSTVGSQPSMIYYFTELQLNFGFR